MIVAIAFVALSSIVALVVVGILAWTKRDQSTAIKRRPRDDQRPEVPKETPKEAPKGFDPETAVFHCYENQNSGTLVRMKPNMEKFDQFVEIMNASKSKSEMTVGPVYFTDSSGKKRSGGYELRLKINVRDAKTVPTLKLIPNTFPGDTYKVNLFDYLSIMLYPIGNEDCEYDVTRHFGSGSDRLQKNLLKFYVRHISKKSGYKAEYDSNSYLRQFFTIDDSTDYSKLFKVKDVNGSVVDFPSGDVDVHYKGIELPSDGTLEIRKVGNVSSLKTMNFIVRITYAGYGQSNLTLYRGQAPGPYEVSIDSVVVLTLSGM